jgi:hypothetical protein
MNPVLAACQLVNVSKPGQEPPLGDGTPEDIRLMLPNCVVRKAAATGRCRWHGQAPSGRGVACVRACKAGRASEAPGRGSARAHSGQCGGLGVLHNPGHRPPGSSRLPPCTLPQDDKGCPLPAEKRRKWCDVPANVEGAVFDTE